MFEDLKHEFDLFDSGDYDDEERHRLLLKVHQRINAHKEEFITHMKGLGFYQDFESPKTYRDILYQAVVLNSTGWEEYLLSELKFLVERQEKYPDYEDNDLQSIHEITYMVETDNQAYYHECMKILYPRIKSRNKYLKAEVCHIICMFHKYDLYKLSASEIQTLQGLLKDSSFYIKVSSYAELRKANILPAGYKLNWWDKLRIKFQGLEFLLS